MANMYLVFSAPPSGVTADEYDRWYHHHIRENLAAPGFVAGQRFSLTPAVTKDESPRRTRHLALYEFEGELARWRTDLETRIGTGNRPSECFPQIRFGSWECTPVDERVVVPEVVWGRAPGRTRPSYERAAWKAAPDDRIVGPLTATAVSDIGGGPAWYWTGVSSRRGNSQRPSCLTTVSP